MYRIALAVALTFSSSFVSADYTCNTDAPIFLTESDNLHLIDLDFALQRVYNNTPSLVAAELETEIRGAEVEQLSLWPNPEFAAEFDKLGGRDQPLNQNAAEYTYSITQLFELGGKRGSRITVAGLRQCVSEWELEMLKLDLRHQTISALIGIFAEQEKVKLALQRKNTYAEALDSVKAKVENGKVSIIQQHQAEITYAKAEHALEHSLRGFQTSKLNLIALWNCAEEFDGVTYPFFEITPPPSFCTLSTELTNNPDIMRWDIEIAAAEENYNLQRAESIPDVLVTAGVVDVKQSKNPAYTLEFVIPIPVFNRNQGNIAVSEYQICQTQTKKQALLHSMSIDLSTSYQEWLCSYHEAISIRDKILKKAIVSFEDVREGYKHGKYELMDLLNAQHILADTEEEYIQVLIEYHRQKAKVERLIGKTIEQ